MHIQPEVSRWFFFLLIIFMVNVLYLGLLCFVLFLLLFGRGGVGWRVKVDIYMNWRLYYFSRSLYYVVLIFNLSCPSSYVIHILAQN